MNTRVWRIAAVALWMLASCAAPPSQDERYNDTIVATKHAPGVDFTQYKTFFLRPEIRTFNDDGEIEPIADRTAKPLLDATEKALVARGFKSVADRGSADLGVEMIYLESVTTQYWCYSWWDPYYWGWYGWWYYPYYGGCDAATWRSGMLATIVVDMSVAAEGGLGQAGEGGGGPSGPPQALPGVWFSGVYAVALDSQQALDGVNQGFAQSPYLKASP